jgi:two-component system response regulator AtoC
VAVNIGGIHEGLMESELFGHEKGSFTGAASRKQGLFVLAGRGCLFLDEVGEMPTPLQVKLLRVLQDRKARRLGGTSDIPINARIISATNQNLEAQIKEGRFREDLYYRLNVFRINIPPLRERAGDIPLLAEHFLAKHGGRTKPVLSPKALEKLANYSFPGNVRELENIIERALIYCENSIILGADIDLHEKNSVSPLTQNMEQKASPRMGGHIQDGNSNQAGANANGKIPSTTRQAEGVQSPTLDEIEKQAIISALASCDGNRTHAAEMLGVSRKTILNKLKQYGLE